MSEPILILDPDDGKNTIADGYLIDFDTNIAPGKIQAVRVRLDMITIEDMTKKFRIDLCDHPLYKELQQYVKSNPR